MFYPILDYYDNAIKVVNAEFNQSDIIFGQFAGSQCVAMALGGIIYLKVVKSPQNWIREELNNILFESHGLYCDVRRKSKPEDIPLSGYLLVNNFNIIKHNLILFGKKISLIYPDEDDIYGLIEGSHNFLDDVDLNVGIENLFSVHPSALLTAGNRTVAIMRSEDFFFSLTHTHVILVENLFCSAHKENHVLFNAALSSN